jgi:hypothetical protein
MWYNKVTNKTRGKLIMANSEEIIAQMKFRLNYQVNACNESAKLLSNIETGDSEVNRRLRIALAEIAAIKAISERKISVGVYAEKIFGTNETKSWADYEIDDNG